MHTPLGEALLARVFAYPPLKDAQLFDIKAENLLSEKYSNEKSLSAKGFTSRARHYSHTYAQNLLATQNPPVFEALITVI